MYVSLSLFLPFSLLFPVSFSLLVLFVSFIRFLLSIVVLSMRVMFSRLDRAPIRTVGCSAHDVIAVRQHDPYAQETAGERPQTNLLAILKQNEKQNEDDDKVVPSTAEEKANAATVKHFLESKKAIVTKLWWQRFAKAKIVASKDMFDELVQKGFFLAVDTKSTSENFIPTVACAKSLEDVLKIDYESETTVLLERLKR